jgi:hypothetical protein
MSRLLFKTQRFGDVDSVSSLRWNLLSMAPQIELVSLSGNSYFISVHRWNPFTVAQ